MTDLVIRGVVEVLARRAFFGLLAVGVVFAIGYVLGANTGSAR